MPFEPQIAIYDACVLYPFHLRNLLIQCAVDRLVEARWTDEIHDEWIRNLAANAPGVSAERLQKTRNLMNAVLPDATVRCYEHHIPEITLPDTDDRHVVAVGISASASVIVTWNTRDFPSEELRKYGLSRQTPDDFLFDLYRQFPEVVVTVIANARRNLRKTGLSAAEFIDALKRQKLTRFVAEISRHIDDI
ncbi:PIN domain-containing protein [Phyllobacterium sp. LjRoot231]|uniref:PIN domain-containing protein n=1 Tax=Phyllobacterium sp. LjRoot231 TaxID=3342289 RepID=UPI003ECCDDCC